MDNLPQQTGSTIPTVQPQSPVKTKAKGWWEKTTGQPLRLRDKIVLIVLGVVFLFAFYVTLDANKFRAQVRVVAGTDKVGINPTAESLDFGDLARGMSALRRVAVQNSTFMPMYVFVWKTGSMSGLLKLNESSFTLQPYASSKIEFTTYMPASAEINKIYDGRVYVFKVPTFWL